MKSSLGWDTVKLSTSKIIVTFFSLIVVMLLSRITTLEEYGTYSQILLIVNLAVSFMMLGLPNSINFFLAKADNNEDKQNFVSVYYTLTTLLSIATGIILIVISPSIIKYFDNTNMAQFTYILLILPWAKVMINSIENVLVVSRKTRILLIFRITHSVFMLMAVFVIYFNNLGLKEYFIIFILVEIIFAVSVYITINKSVSSIDLKINKILLINILKFSLPIGIASIIGTLNIQVDKLIISRLLGTNELALYTNASREMPVTMIAVSLTAVLLPRLVEYIKTNRITKANQLWKEAIILSYYIVCFFTTVFFVFPSDMLSLLYSERYVTGASVFRVYSLVLLLRTTYFGIMLNSIGKTKFILYSSIASLMTNILLNFIFIQLFGLIGPALATLLALSMMAFVQLIATAKVTKIRFSCIFPWKFITKISIINIIFGVLMFLSKNIINRVYNINTVIESASISVTFGLIYIGFNWKKMLIHWNKLNEE